MLKKLQFKGQGKQLLRGAKACGSVAIAAFARFSAMDDREFANTFITREPKKENKPKDENKYTQDFQKKKAERVLNDIVKTGANINNKISGSGPSSFFKLLDIHETRSIWEKISPAEKDKFRINNLERGLTRSLCVFGKEITLLEEKNTETKQYNSMKEAFMENWNNIQDQNQNNNRDIGFVITTAGHTTVVFQRKINNKDYFVSFNSGDKNLELNMIDRHFRQEGQMEIHDTLDSLCDSLIQQWKDENTSLIRLSNTPQTTPNQIDITLFRSTAQRIPQPVPPEGTPQQRQLFHLIQDIVFMPELKHLAATSTGIRMIRKELFENNGDIETILLKIKSICLVRISSNQKRHPILENIYKTINQTNIQKIKLLSEGTITIENAINRLGDIKSDLTKYAQHQDVREHSSPRRP